jgi:thioredoxin-dependent peroxiredoxin
MADVGQKAPGASWGLSGGASGSVADHKGRKLVIYFYPKDDTSGCTKEAQEFTALAADFGTAGTDIVGISRDSVKSHDKFTGKYDLKVALGSDEGGEVTEAFGVWVEKSMYGKKYMGIERATFLIDGQGTIQRVWRKVKVPGHAAEVLEAAKAL